MKPEYDPQLEAAVDRELRALQDLPAPPTLIPRVLAALSPEPVMQWWHQPWWRWPLPVRIASCAATLLMLAVLCGGSAWVDAAGQPAQAWVSDRFGSVLAMAGGWQGGLGIIHQWAPVTQAQWLVIFALIGGSYLACLGMGTLLVRISLNKTRPI